MIFGMFGNHGWAVRSCVFKENHGCIKENGDVGAQGWGAGEESGGGFLRAKRR